MLITMLVLLASVPDGAPVAPAAATWTLSGTPGRVTALTARIKTGGRLVADGFVNDASARTEERSALAQTQARRGSCSWAAAARPFTRLRRFAANGRLLWTWNAGGQDTTVQLMAPDGADCLSPDGRWLLARLWYRLRPGNSVAEAVGVVALELRPAVGVVNGARTGEVLGRPSVTDPVGWRAGKPATLMFDVTTDNGSVTTRDEGVARRQSGR